MIYWIILGIIIANVVLLLWLSIKDNILVTKEDAEVIDFSDWLDHIEPSDFDDLEREYYE